MSGLLEIVKLVVNLLRGANNALELLAWALNASLDLFLHAAWSGVASLLGLWLAYWVVRGLYFVLGGRTSGEGGQPGLDFVLTRRVVGLCIIAQFMMDILGHAYAVFRQDLPVTLANLGRHSARDFHAEAWCLSLAICGVVGVYLAIRLVDALKHPGDGLPMRLDEAMRKFGYTVALFAALSAHMWWDRLLSFG